MTVLSVQKRNYNFWKYGIKCFPQNMKKTKNNIIYWENPVLETIKYIANVKCHSILQVNMLCYLAIRKNSFNQLSVGVKEQYVPKPFWQFHFSVGYHTLFNILFRAKNKWSTKTNTSAPIINRTSLNMRESNA